MSVPNPTATPGPAGLLPGSTDEAGREAAPPGRGASRARQHLPARRGVFGRRFYDADHVDQLLDSLEQHLAAVMGEAGRLRIAHDRLSRIEHARRHGLLPTGMPEEEVDQDQVRLVIQAQTADQILADANTQAAALIAAARHHYLHPDLSPGATSATAGEEQRQARAQRAEAGTTQLAQFLHQWATWATGTAAQQVDAAQQHAQVLHEAAATVLRLLADTATDVGGGQ